MPDSINKILTPAELADFLGVQKVTDISDDIYEDYLRFMKDGLIPSYTPRGKGD